MILILRDDTIADVQVIDGADLAQFDTTGTLRPETEVAARSIGADAVFPITFFAISFPIMLHYY